MLGLTSHVVLVLSALFPYFISKVPKFRAVSTGSGSSVLDDARKHAQWIKAPGLANCEDILVWKEARVAIASCDPDRGKFNAFTGEGQEDLAAPGALWVVDLDTRACVRLEIDSWPEGKSLHPLGVGLRNITTDSTSESDLEAILSVVNYGQASACIEMIRLIRRSATGTVQAVHLSTLSHPFLATPNAVVPLSTTSVLVTNSFRHSPRTSPALHVLEQFLALPGGSLCLLRQEHAGQPATCTRLISNISFANGVAINPSRTILAVAGCTSNNIHIYNVLHFPPTRQDDLSFRKTIHVGYLPDNLRFVDNAHSPTPSFDTLLVAGHPSGLAFLRMAKSPEKPYRSPSRLVSITLEHAEPRVSAIRKAINGLQAVLRMRDPSVRLLFESLGDYHGTSSTAAHFRSADNRDSLLIAGLFQDGLLILDDVNMTK